MAISTCIYALRGWWEGESAQIIHGSYIVHRTGETLHVRRCARMYAWGGNSSEVGSILL